MTKNKTEQQIYITRKKRDKINQQNPKENRKTIYVDRKYRDEKIGYNTKENRRQNH